MILKSLVISGFAFVFSNLSFADDIKYVLSKPDSALGSTAQLDCYKHENERRAIIEKNNLPTNLQFAYGHTTNKWGDMLDHFCYIAYGNTAYIFWNVPIYKPSRPVTTISIR